MYNPEMGAGRRFNTAFRGARIEPTKYHPVRFVLALVAFFAAAVLGMVTGITPLTHLGLPMLLAAVVGALCGIFIAAAIAVVFSQAT